MIRSGIRRLFRLDLRDRDLRAREVDDEIALHIDLRTEELVARGMLPYEARREAERRFGQMAQARHTLQQSAMRTETRMALRDQLDALWHDLAYAARYGRSCVVFTSVSGGVLNADLYFPDGVVLDLGEVREPS